VKILDLNGKQIIGHVVFGKIMIHYIYKITNTINGKYYIGRHSTNSIDDGYMGSGIGLKNAIKKYGIDNFNKEIIIFTEDSISLWELEKQIVNEQVVKDKMSYNMSYGGKHYLYALKEYDKEAFRKHQSEAGKKGANSFYSKMTTEEKKVWHKKGSDASPRNTGKLAWNSGKTYTCKSIECPKCGKIGGGPNMTRYHFNNCKM